VVSARFEAGRKGEVTAAPIGQPGGVFAAKKE
jgi:hypothetical protein